MSSSISIERWARLVQVATPTAASWWSRVGRPQDS